MTFKTKTIAAAILAGALALPGLALAEHNPPVNPNPSELRQDFREYTDDVRDIGRLERMAQRYEVAVAQRQWRYLPALDARLAEVLQSEIAETQRELALDRREVRQDFRRDRRAYDHPADRRDDVRDLRAERMALWQLQNLSVRLQVMRGRFDWSALQEKRAIIRELIAMNRREVREDRREIRETVRDHREVREIDEPYYPRRGRF